MTFNELNIGDRFRIVDPDPADLQLYRKTGMFEFYSYEVGDNFRVVPDAAKRIVVEKEPTP